MDWEKAFDQKFGIFGHFWEKWATGDFPEEGGISDDLKSFIRHILEENNKLTKEQLKTKISDTLRQDDCHESFLDGFQKGCPNEHYNQAVTDILHILN